MKLPCAALFLVCIYAGAAFGADSLYYKLSGNASCVYAIPIGELSSRSNNHQLTGQCKPSIGFGMDFNYHINSRIALGLDMTTVAFRVNREKIQQNIAQQYSENGYYNSFFVGDYNFRTTCFAFTTSYHFNTKFCEAEPYLLVSTGFFEFDDIGEEYSVNQKKHNDNYYKNTTAHFSHKSTISPGFGFRLSKQLFHFIYCSLGLRYNFGEINYTIDEFTKYIDDNYTTREESFTQKISLIQVHGGLQIRLWKKRK